MSEPGNNLARNIGRFTGEIWRAIRLPVSASPTQSREIRRTVETGTQETGTGKVTLRRTTIEEIEVESE